MRLPCVFAAAAVFALLPAGGSAATYHVDAANGDDANDGLSPAAAWKSLDKVNGLTLQAGDSVLLKRGSVCKGHLILRNAAGAEGRPVAIDAYGAGAAPVIDAAGAPPGIHLISSNYVEIANLEITADDATTGESKGGPCRGIYFTAPDKGAFGNLVLRKLHIHDIFAKNQRNGNGIDFDIPTEAIAAGAVVSNILIEDCVIERTAALGITMQRVRNVRVIGNRLTDIGGPGIRPQMTRGLVIRGNTVDRSGSRRDPRMSGRGSCSWILGCTDVLVEKNRFMNAWGINDSCGFHIDIGNTNVVVQYNLSIHNAGGFVEVLGKNKQCAYRYNVSVNDGWRVKGQEGATNDGRILWVSGFNIRPGVPVGPYNTYLYNNTIYLEKNTRAMFAFVDTAEGVLVANNIFHIEGAVEYKVNEWDRSKTSKDVKIKNAVFANNLFLKEDCIPKEMPGMGGKAFFGDAGFAKAGGIDAADYVPRNVALVKGKGVAVEKLPGDDVGLKEGLEVKTDILGNPIVGLPDLGAVEAP